MKEHEHVTPEALRSSKESNLEKKKSIEVDLSVRSEEVQEIIGSPPHWLIRGGIGMFLAVLGMIFIAASFIQYPEVIKSELTLIAMNAPKTVKTKINSKIIKLFKENMNEVVEGDVLGWMESTADHLAVELLSTKIDSLEFWIAREDFAKVKNSKIFTIQKLGELQSGTQVFSQAYREFILYIPDGYYDERKKILEQELSYTVNLLSKLEMQKEIQQANYDLSKQEFEAQKKLADKELIAKLDLLKAENELSNKRLPLQQTESAIINNQVAQVNKKKEMMELERQFGEALSRFSQALYTLRSAIDEWKYKYVLTAPISGTLTYSGIIQEQQPYRSDQEIFYIQPENSEFFGEMKISQASYGKIEEGQEILVRFSGFPYHEFGSVIGVIEYLSEFPVGDSLFFAKVDFPDGLKTNYGKVLPPANGMRGQAKIITKDMILLKRIYNNLTKNLR